MLQREQNLRFCDHFKFFIKKTLQILCKRIIGVQKSKIFPSILLFSIKSSKRRYLSSTSTLINLKPTKPRHSLLNCSNNFSLTPYFALFNFICIYTLNFPFIFFRIVVWLCFFMKKNFRFFVRQILKKSERKEERKTI